MVSANLRSKMQSLEHEVRALRLSLDQEKAAVSGWTSLLVL